LRDFGGHIAFIFELWTFCWNDFRFWLDWRRWSWGCLLGSSFRRNLPLCRRQLAKI